MAGSSDNCRPFYVLLVIQEQKLKGQNVVTSLRPDNPVVLASRI